MNSTKKVVYITVLTILMYFTFTFIESKIVDSKANKTEVSILVNDVNKGDKLTKNCYKKIKVITNNKLNYNIDLNSDKYLNVNLKKGQILYNDLLVSKDEILKASQNKEIVSIPLKYSYDAVSYKVSKDSLVNIYFSTKTKYLEGIMHNKEVLANENTEGFSTLIFAKNAKVIDVVDREGNSRKNSEKFIPETILVEMDSSDAKMIKNFKNIGEFSLTMER